MELVEDGDGRLSVVLAGHPKLRNDLRKPTMEEIGYRTDVFSLDGITGHEREYIQWLLKICSEGQSEADPMLTDDALELLAAKLRTPPANSTAPDLGARSRLSGGRGPVQVEVVESILSRHIDDLEPTLTRHGYRIKDLMEQLDAKSADIKALFNNTLDPVRATELREKMLRAGLPFDPMIVADNLSSKESIASPCG